MQNKWHKTECHAFILFLIFSLLHILLSVLDPSIQNVHIYPDNSTHYSAELQSSQTPVVTVTPISNVVTARISTEQSIFASLKLCLFPFLWCPNLFFLRKRSLYAPTHFHNPLSHANTRITRFIHDIDGKKRLLK